jgi:hypothetical protein
MTQEQLRMQLLSGIITEGEYKAKLEEITLEAPLPDYLSNSTPIYQGTYTLVAQKVKGKYGDQDVYSIDVIFGKYDALGWKQTATGNILSLDGGDVEDFIYPIKKQSYKAVKDALTNLKKNNKKNL